MPTKMFTVIAALACGGLLAHSWTDSNGVEWIMPSQRVNNASALRKCRAAGFRLPSSEVFWEAIDLGLLDPEINTAFGESAKSIDWIWVRESATTPSFNWMASRWEDLALDLVTQRHWVLCARARALVS